MASFVPVCPGRRRRSGKAPIHRGNEVAVDRLAGEERLLEVDMDVWWAGDGRIQLPLRYRSVRLRIPYRVGRTGLSPTRPESEAAIPVVLRRSCSGSVQLFGTDRGEDVLDHLTPRPSFSPRIGFRVRFPVSRSALQLIKLSGCRCVPNTDSFCSFHLPLDCGNGVFEQCGGSIGPQVAVCRVTEHHVAAGKTYEKVTWTTLRYVNQPVPSNGDYGRCSAYPFGVSGDGTSIGQHGVRSDVVLIEPRQEMFECYILEICTGHPDVTVL